MTYFDDEMPAEPKKPRSPLYRWLRRLLIGLAAFGVLLFISLRLLMGINGTNPALRQGLEGYFNALTGLSAKINTFNSLTLYPAIAVDMGDVEFMPPAPTKAAGVPAGPVVASIGSFKVAMGFWDAAFKRGRMRALEIKGVDFGENLHLPRPVTVEIMALQKDKDSPHSRLRVEGHYGGDDFTAEQEMTWIEKDGKPGYFWRPRRSAFSVASKFLNARGFLQAAPGNVLQFDFDSIGLPEPLLKGHAFLQRDGKGYALDAHLKGGHSDFVIKLQRSRDKMTGTVHMLAFDPADINILRALHRTAYLLMPGLNEDVIEKDLTLSLDVQIDSLQINGAKIGQLDFPVTADKGVLTIGPVKGVISGGAVSGKFTVDSAVKPATLTGTAMARDFDYGALQKNLYGRDIATGKATMALLLNGQGRAADEILDNLKGEAALVAGTGEIAPQLMTVSGKNIAGLMLPKAGIDPAQAMSLQCFLTDMKVEKSAAHAGTFLLSLKPASVTGAGTLDPVNRTLDITLTPHVMFDDAADDKATLKSAHVSGPWDKLKVAARPLATKKKTDEDLALNAMFAGFSLADLGLDDHHPCRALMKNAEIKKMDVAKPATSNAIP